MKTMDEDTGREFVLFNSEELRQETSEYWEAKCAHAVTELGRVRYKNESVHVRNVCLECGEFVGDTIKKQEEHEALPLIDQESIRGTYSKARRKGYEEILQKHVRIQRKRDAGFQKEYIAYLSSAKWKDKRDKVLKRANFTCEGCLDKSATVIHHLKYEHIYEEMLFELVALCSDCHAICHPEKNELTDDEVFSGDLPCYGCRFYGQTEEGSWCTKFDVHTVISLIDRERCGPKASALEQLR